MSDDTQDEQTVSHADLPPEVSVSAASQGPTGKPYKGMSPLAAGLLYGGAAATVMGPLAIIPGLIAGVTAKRMRDNYLDQQAREARQFSGETRSIYEEMDSIRRTADPDTQKLIDHAKLMTANGWYRIQSGDESGRDMIQQGQAMMTGILQDNIQQRNADMAANHAMQRSLVTTAANDYRAQYQQNIEQATGIDQQAERVLALANDPNFDPDKPANKAILAQLVSTGVNGLYKDAPDVFDAVGHGTDALAHIPVFGGAAKDIAGGILTYMKSQDFKVSKEDWNRIALNMKNFNTQYVQRKMDQLGQQSDALGAFAQRSGMLPPDYTMRDYISGKMKNINFNPPPNVPTAEVKKPAPPPVYGPSVVPGRGNPNFINQPFKPVGIQDAIGGTPQWNPNTRYGGAAPRPTN